MILTEGDHNRGEQAFNLPENHMTARDMAEAYAYALNKWGLDSVQSREMLDRLDRCGGTALMQELKDEVSELNFTIEEMHTHPEDYFSNDYLECEISSLKLQNLEMELKIEELEGNQSKVIRGED